jgi:hypothetical protein
MWLYVVALSVRGGREEESGWGREEREREPSFPDTVFLPLMPRLRVSPVRACPRGDTAKMASLPPPASAKVDSAYHYTNSTYHMILNDTECITISRDV